MKRPLFSCVVPVKGSRPFMDAALDSLSAQEMGDDLEIIVQDGDVEPDAGQSDALNRGFAKARGDWLFWLNADDILLPGALRAVRDLSERRGLEVDWISGNVQYIDVAGRILRCAVDRGARWMYRGLPMRVYGPSSFFRRALYERCRVEGTGFDVGLRYMMDTDLWERFRRAGAWPIKVKRYIWGFRIHTGSLTSEDLYGRTPAAMLDEYRLLDSRYCTCRGGWRSKWIRIIRLMDGSYLRAALDTFRLKGKGVCGV